MIARLIAMFSFSILTGCASSAAPRDMVVRQLPPHPTEIVSERAAPPGVNLNIDSYEDCVAAGNMTTKTLPPRCIAADGRVFVKGQVAPIQKEIESFDDCVAAGNTIRRTFPATCMDAQGRVFTAGQLRGNVQSFSFDQESIGEGKKLCKDMCGDGECQEIVCMAVGCPCPETPNSCPRDCK